MRIKRALSFVTVLCLLLSLPVFTQPSYAAGQQDNTLGLLSALGIIEQDAKFAEDTPLTREEAAVLLHRLLGGMDASGASFPDVSPDSDSYSAISVVSSAKIMSGYSDGSFGIYDHMTVEQMAKALVSILGYGVAAAQKGGYPSGYLAVSADLKLFENVAFEASKPISKASALQMIYNSLEAPMMIVEDYANTKLVVDESKTLLSSVFKTRKVRGVITGDGTRTIYLDGKGAKGEKIAIDNIEYTASPGVDAKSYLGYRVEAFVRYVNDDSNEEVIYLAPSRLNDALSIKSEDIINVSQRRIEYIDENDKEVDVEISRNADFLYNGVAKVPDNPDMLNVKYGDISLIDNDGDGIYDVVIIRSQILAVVESVNASDMVVSFKHGIPYLDLSEVKDFAIVKGGEKIELSQLVRGNVVAICADVQVVQNGIQLPSPDSAYIEINVFDKIITDKVAEIGDDYIVVGKRKYQTTPYFEEMDEAYKVTINAGITYKFYLDGQNRIVFAEKLAGELEYGYLINASASRGLVQTVKIKVLTEFNEVETLTLNEYLTLDGESRQKAERFLELVVKDNKVERQVIGFRRNSENIIFEIDTLNLNSKYETETDSLIKSVPLSTSKLYYRSSDKALGGKIVLSDNATVFLVPYNSENPVDDAFSTRGAGYFVNNNYYYVEGYNFKDAQKCSLVVAYYESAVDDLTGVSVIDKVVKAVDYDGNVIRKIYVHSNLGYNAYNLSEDSVYFNNQTGVSDYTIDSLDTGDLIRFTTDKFSKIISLEALFDASAPRKLGTTGAFRDTFRISYGYVYDLNENVIKMVYDQANFDNYDLFNLNSTYITVYDRERKEIRKVSTANIVSYKSMGDFDKTTKMLIYTRNGSSLFAVIY